MNTHKHTPKQHEGKGATKVEDQEKRQDSTALATKPGQEVAEQRQHSQLPETLRERAVMDAGKGVSGAREDNLIPFMRALQDLSPQVLERNPLHVPGAKAGMIWLRNRAHHPLVPGDEGVTVQFCAFTKDWVEWKSRDDGGGFIGRFDEMPADAEKITDPKNPNKVKFVRKSSGNQVKETRYHYVLVGNMAYVIAMAGTGHTTSRGWMSLFNQFRDASGAAEPSWIRKWRMTTFVKSNSQGSWYEFQIEDEGYIQTEQEYEMGLAFHNAVTSGQKKAESPTDQDIPFDDGESSQSDSEKI